MNFQKNFEVDAPYEKSYEEWGKFINQRNKEYADFISETVSPFIGLSAAFLSLTLCFGMFFNLREFPINLFEHGLQAQIFTNNISFLFGSSVFLFSFLFIIYVVGGISTSYFSKNTDQSIKRKVFRALKRKEKRSRYLNHPDQQIRELTRQTFLG